MSAAQSEIPVVVLARNLERLRPRSLYSIERSEGVFTPETGLAAGVLREWDTVRFGFHDLLHSLASFLLQAGTNPKTVQTLLRHAGAHTTLQIYAHSRNEDHMTAQGDMLTAFFAPTATVQ